MLSYYTHFYKYFNCFLFGLYFIYYIALNTKQSEKKNTTSVTKIISGGQTGVDTIGLQVAKELGIETGGKAPKGFLREEGIDNEDIA